MPPCSGVHQWTPVGAAAEAGEGVEGGGGTSGPLLIAAAMRSGNEERQGPSPLPTSPASPSLFSHQYRRAIAAEYGRQPTPSLNFRQAEASSQATPLNHGRAQRGRSNGEPPARAAAGTKRAGYHCDDAGPAPGPNPAGRAFRSPRGSGGTKPGPGPQPTRGPRRS